MISRRLTEENPGCLRNRGFSLVAPIEDQIRGKIVPIEMYDEAQRLLKEYRAARGAKPK